MAEWSLPRLRWQFVARRVVMGVLVLACLSAVACFDPIGDQDGDGVSRTNADIAIYCEKEPAQCDFCVQHPDECLNGGGGGGGCSDCTEHQD